MKILHLHIIFDWCSILSESLLPVVIFKVNSILEVILGNNQLKISHNKRN